MVDLCSLFGAGDEARTRYLHLGKVALYRMSYTRNNGLYYSRYFPFVKEYFKKILPAGNSKKRQSVTAPFPLLFLMLFHIVELVRCRLVDDIVEPVGIQ